MCIYNYQVSLLKIVMIISSSKLSNIYLYLSLSSTTSFDDKVLFQHIHRYLSSKLLPYLTWYLFSFWYNRLRSNTQLCDLKPCYSECGPWRSRIGIIWEHVRHRDSRAPPRLVESESSLQQDPRGIHVHITVWEALV